MGTEYTSKKRFYRTRRVRYRSGDLGEDRTTQWCDLTDFPQKCCMPESLSLQYPYDIIKILSGAIWQNLKGSVLLPAKFLMPAPPNF